MLKSRLHYLLFLLLLSSCATQYVANQYSFTDEQVKATADKDKSIDSIIQPYKLALDKEMNIVIGYADDALTKTQPESDLGTFMCDLVLKKTRDYTGQHIDFTFLNHGGIRLPSLPKGDITYGKMIELMPFENRIAVMEVTGLTLDSLFNHMAAKGGWHVSGATYKIKNGKAVDVTIQGQPLQSRGVYTMAVSDYLAQGGDNCTMLQGIPYTDTKKTLRDALIEGVKEMTAKGEHIKSVLDGRVQTVKQ